MRTFDELLERAARRKGGVSALEAHIPKPKSARAIAAIADDRWLAAMTQGVFQAGFVWRVVEHKWPGFEAALHGFDAHALAYLSDEDIEKLLADTRIIRHHAKLLATRDNAQLVLDLAQQHGGAGAFFASFGPRRYAELLEVLKKRGARLGGMTAQYFLRRMGLESWVLSIDVVRVLVDEGVLHRAPSSKRDMQAVQAAFDHWCEQSGKSLTYVSRVLAMSID
ncbi:MAG: DNA-3-methyladenine glycosylase I [Gammaproteobacteria bacterium]|nr:DNA-3-methyladenine glycosylase I [Gammaproteobacteria bacterium]